MPDTALQPVKRYYPTLGQIVGPEDIPEILGFLKQGIEELLNKVHYKDLQYTKSPQGDAAFYSLAIVSRERLDIEVPGTGIFLILNPALEDQNISAFPITIEYQWKILAYIRQFNLEGFSFAPREFFQLGLQILNISEEQALAHIINNFVEPTDENTTSLEQFVNDLNAGGLNIQLPTEGNKLKDVAQQLFTSTGNYGSYVAFGTYMLSTDATETKEKTKQFYRNFIPGGDFESYIKDIIIPKAAASLELSAAMEFPRSILQPVTDENGNNPATGESTGLGGYEVIPEDEEGFPRVQFHFGSATFFADTEEGLGYNMDLALNTTYPAMLGKSGIIVEIQNLKVDLSDNKNIEEATLDGRPPTFKGVYADEVAIILPKKWFNKQTGQTLKISGQRLLLGTGGISGTLALEATPAIDTETGEAINYYDDYFTLQYPVNILHTEEDGTQTIIRIEEAEGTEGIINYINTQNSGSEPSFLFPVQLTLNGADQPITIQSEQEYNTLIRNLSPLPGDYMWFDLGGNPNKRWELGFNSFDIQLNQGSVVQSNLRAALKVQKLRDENDNDLIAIDGHYSENGDLNLTASFGDSPLRMNLFEFLALDFKTIEVGRQEDDFYLGTSCEISFTNEIMNKFMNGQSISIERLRLYSDGAMEIEGGTGYIPAQLPVLDLGPMQFATTGIHIGSYQGEDELGRIRKYNYIGFDGALGIDPFGIDVRGDGVKYYYTVDNDEFGDDGHNFIHISTIEIDITIPGDASPDDATAIIKGSLTISEPGESQEIWGEVSLEMPNKGISGLAKLRMQPKYPAYIVEAGIGFPKPIPFVAPIGFYAFKGLLGHNYVADRQAVGLTSEDSWYDWYMAPNRGVGLDKFSGPERAEEYSSPFSVGVGTVLATVGDDGNIFSSRIALMFSNLTFFLHGKANILAKRIGLMDTKEPPFFFMLSVGSDGVEFSFGADYELPSTGSLQGDIIEIHALVQASFRKNDPNGWFINFGTKEDPITAKAIFKLFAMQSFVMLSAQGIEAGARAEVGFDKKFGPVRITALIYAEVGGKISFERPQIGGFLAFGGYVRLKVWKVRLVSFEFDVMLAAEAPRPFLLYASFRIKVCVWKFCRKFKVEVKWEFNKQIDTEPIAPISLPDVHNEVALPDRRLDAVKAVHMLTDKTFDLQVFTAAPSNSTNITKVIPLDSYIDITTAKGLLPTAIDNKVGGHTHGAVGYTEKMSPVASVAGKPLRQVKHQYSIEDIEIFASSNGSPWQSYHPYLSLDPDQTDLANQPLGYWQKAGKEYNHLRIPARTPFDYMDGGQPGWVVPEQFGIGPSTLFCAGTNRAEHCHNYINYEEGIFLNLPMPNPLADTIPFYELADSEPVIVTDQFGNTEIVYNAFLKIETVDNPFNLNPSLTFENGGSLYITLPESSKTLTLKLSTFASGVTIKCLKTGPNHSSAAPDYILVNEEYKTKEELATPYSFESPNDQFIRVEIIPDSTDWNRIQEIYILLAQILERAENNGGDILDEDQTLFSSLQNELQSLLAVSCSSGASDDDFCSELCNKFNNCFFGILGPDFEPGEIEYWVEKILLAGLCYKGLYYVAKNNTTDPVIINLIDEFRLIHIELYQGNYIGETELTNEEVINHYNQLYNKGKEIIDMLCGTNYCAENNSGCTTAVHEVCWMTEEDYEFNLILPGQEAINADREEMIAAIENTVQPIWRPNTKYYVKVTLKDEVNDGEESGEFDYYYGFKTEGPLGFYNLPEGSDPNQSPLAILDQYIDYNRSYPEAGGNLLQSKPLFYGHQQAKISLYLTEPLAYHFFQNWKAYGGLPAISGEIELFIKDPVINEIISYPLPSELEQIEVPHPEFGEPWEDDEDPNLPLSIQLWINMMEAVNEMNGLIECDIDLGDRITPQAFKYERNLTNLKPRKLYSVQVHNKYDGLSKKIHDFVFQTSRYENFREQVMSYQLSNQEGERKDAVFTVDVNLSEEKLNAMYSLVKGTPDTYAQNLEKDYLDPLDRIWEGILGQKPLDPAVTTEFNIIKNTDGNRVGILIRNPEPFNFPKISSDRLIDMIRPANSNGEISTSTYKNLYAKDYSQVLIMHHTKVIPSGVSELQFIFRYLTWHSSPPSQANPQPPLSEPNKPDFYCDENDEMSYVLTTPINLNS